MKDLQRHFEIEFSLLRKKYGEDLLLLNYQDALRNIVDIFSNEGHSGSSAPFTAGALSATIRALLLFEPLTEISATNDDEWMSVDGGFYQNIRYSAIFKDGKDARPYFLDALVWQEINGSSFTGAVMHEGKKISSKGYIKDLSEFPYQRFFVNVMLNAQGDFEVSNTSQLAEAAKYYDFIYI
jgi:hypothetical protein